LRLSDSFTASRLSLKKAMLPTDELRILTLQGTSSRKRAHSLYECKQFHG